MKIIDKHKDYYDYLVGIYGMDEKIIYDRRGSIKILSHRDMNDSVYYYKQRVNSKLFQAGPDIEIDLLFSRDVITYEDPSASYKDYVEKDLDLRCSLVVGYYTYSFLVKRGIKEGKIQLIPTLLEMKEERNRWVDKDCPDCPVILTSGGRMNVNGICPTSNWVRINNPILKETWITGLIPAEEMWDNISNFLSSKIEKPFIDTRTNEQHIESNGFDKKTSFRNV